MSWHFLINNVIVAAFTGFSVGTLDWLLRRFLGMPPGRITPQLSVGLICGYVAGFRFAEELTRGLFVSALLVGGGAIVRLTDHFASTLTRHEESR
jgi:hypothetical protein